MSDSAATTHGPGIGCTCEWGADGNPVGGKHKPPCRMAGGSDTAWSYFTHCQASWKLAGDVTEARCPECDETVLRRPRREIGDAPAGDDDLVELRLSDNPGGEW